MPPAPSALAPRTTGSPKAARRQAHSRRECAEKPSIIVAAPLHTQAGPHVPVLSPETTPPCVVIDTQSVLDWCFFEHPVCRTWLSARQTGAWRWIATPAMRAELACVLERGIAGHWPHTPAEVLAFFDRWVELRPAPVPPLAPWPRCRDRDDQKFIDLALLAGARWLVSRDKAVLKLARRCQALTGLAVLPPERWLNPPP